jgi:hypothetical protein
MKSYIGLNQMLNEVAPHESLKSLSLPVTVLGRPVCSGGKTIVFCT